jgi:outer membrane protein assembly factor BamB
VFGAVACGGGAVAGSVFEPSWKSDAGESIARVEAKVRGAARPPDTAVVVGVTANGLAGAELPQGSAWHYTGPVETMPSVAADGVVFVGGGGKVTALDGKTGNALWSVDTGAFKLRGGADDGKFSVLSLGQERVSKSRLFVVDRAGHVVHSLASDTELGRPAARAGVGFVPWGGQYVSALDLDTGNELGRLLTRDLPSHALDRAGTLYFGQYSLVRLDARIKYAESFQATRFTFKPRELPGTPVWLGNGLELPLVDRSARAKIRLFAAPESTSAGVKLASDSYAGTYFRAVYGFAGSDGHLLWADAFNADVVGGGAAASGFVFCDEAGKVHLFDATGGSATGPDLGDKLVGCSVGAGALRVEGSARGPLPAQIEQSFARLDPDMAAAEALLITELGKLADPQVTRILIALCDDSRVPPAQRDAARRLLSKRTNGAEFMLAALDRHYDFVTGTQPPAVGPLADALAGLRDERAAAPLARHLNDPADSLDDVVRVAKALEVLATPAEARELTTFFALYHATANDQGLVEAVVAVGSALLRVGGAEGRATVERAVADPLTQPDVQRELAKLVAPKSAPAKPDAKASVADGKPPKPGDKR